jgi:superoxide dismutase
MPKKHQTNQSRSYAKALEPYINGDIMEIHHSKHHQTYVNNYNAAEEKLSSAFQANDLTQQLTLQNALKFNGGGKQGRLYVYPVYQVLLLM